MLIQVAVYLNICDNNMDEEDQLAFQSDFHFGQIFCIDVMESTDS